MNNRLFTIINFLILAIAILFSIGWLMNIEFCGAISEGAFYIFFFTSLIQMVFNSSIFYNRLFLNLTIALYLAPIILIPLSLNFFEPNLNKMMIIVILSNLGGLIVYSIWYAKKDKKGIVDKLKMFWVFMLSATVLVSASFKVQHWPYQEIVTHTDLIAYVPLLFAFYYSGLKHGFLDDKTLPNIK